MLIYTDSPDTCTVPGEVPGDQHSVKMIPLVLKSLKF